MPKQLFFSVLFSFSHQILEGLVDNYTDQGLRVSQNRNQSHVSSYLIWNEKD